MNSDDTDPWSGGSRCFRSGRDGLGDADASSVAVAVAAVGILLVAVFAWPDQSELTADEPASSTPAVPTTLDILIYAVGTRFFDDAGDVYPVDPNGDSSRISSGDVLAIASPSLLLRECNANWVCNAVLRDYQGGQFASSISRRRSNRDSWLPHSLLTTGQSRLLAPTSPVSGPFST
jgi:hypothetical protein